MLLRFIALHGIPVTEAEWVVFRLWKAAQLAAPPCEMVNPSVGDACCEGCERPDADCPRKHR
jgi:hypothetical protein